MISLVSQRCLSAPNVEKQGYLLECDARKSCRRELHLNSFNVDSEQLSNLLVARCGKLASDVAVLDACKTAAWTNAGRFG